MFKFIHTLKSFCNWKDYIFTSLLINKKSEKDIRLPSDMISEIFSYLNADELANCKRVCKQWKTIASKEAFWYAMPPKVAFGKKQWAKYFGDIGDEPPLPKDIHKILKSPCPFFSGKTIGETHMLVLIPESVDGKPLNLKNFGELVKTPKDGYATQFHPQASSLINHEFGYQTTKSHWVLMTKDIIEGSRSKLYSDQQDLVAKFAEQTGIHYEVPNLRDAAICLSIHHVISGEFLFKNSDPATYTICQEEEIVHDAHVKIGNFCNEGLDIAYAHWYLDTQDCGVAAVRFL